MFARLVEFINLFEVFLAPLFWIVCACVFILWMQSWSKTGHCTSNRAAVMTGCSFKHLTGPIALQAVSVSQIPPAIKWFSSRCCCFFFGPQAGCMYIHGGVVNIQENKRTGSLFRIWLAVPSLLELCWEKLLKSFPHLTSLPTFHLCNLGLTEELVERLK